MLSGKFGLAFLLIAFVVGSVFGCLVFSGLTQIQPNRSSPTEACILCGGGDQAVGRPVPAKIAKERPLEKQAPRGVEILEFRYSVNEGQFERLVLKTTPGDVCTVRYLTPNAQEVTPEHAYQTAGEDGLCLWTWDVKPGSVIPNNNRGTVIYWAGGKMEYIYFTIIPQLGLTQ